ncbi:N-acetyltransferase family protein [Homoserinimonas sp. A447]
MVDIRPIDPRDATRWRELFTDYGTFYKTSFSDEVLDGVWAWLLDPLHPVNGLVASNDDGVVVGFAIYREQPDTFSAGPGMYLDDIFVDPAARRSGVAGAMLSTLRERARAKGVSQIRWITAADNVRAQAAYDRIARKTDWVTYEMDV